MKKLPQFTTEQEWHWYERTPKRVLFAIARDYAMQAVGEAESNINPHLVLEELEGLQEIVEAAGLAG